MTVVAPCAKWACMWRTLRLVDSRSASATACSSSLRYTLRGRPASDGRGSPGRPPRRPRAPAAPGAGGRRARSAGRNGGRLRAQPGRSGRSPTALVVGGRYARRGPDPLDHRVVLGLVGRLDHEQPQRNAELLQPPDLAGDEQLREPRVALERRRRRRAQPYAPPGAATSACDAPCRRS